MTCLNTACILPPEGQLSQADLNFPPEIDLTSLIPDEARLDVSRANCELFGVSATRIVDKDDGNLLIRWVANNDLQSTRLIRSDTSGGEPGEPRQAFVRISVRADFPLEYALTDDRMAGSQQTATGILSLFVTDAPAWEDPNPELTGDAVDLSRIAPGPGGDGGLEAFSVVEVRWAVQIDQNKDGCPQ